MQITKPVALTLLIILTAACASTPGSRGSREAKPPLRGGVAEFQVTSYDGTTLRGRILIGATVDPIVVDGRLYDWVTVEPTNLRECGKKERVRFWSIEPFPRPPRPDEIITIRPGYWYGGKVSFLFSNVDGTDIGLECFDLDVVVLARGSRVAAKVPIRVVRTDKTAAPKDGATEGPKTPPAGGTP